MTIFDIIEDFLDPVLTTSNGSFFLSIGFVVFAALLLGFIKVSTPIILITITSLLIMFVGFGWIPVWIIILITVILFGLFLTNVIGGKSNV